MPGYPAFRDRVAEFFGRYDEFQARYHVTQVTMDGELGAGLSARAAGGGGGRSPGSPRGGMPLRIAEHFALG